MSKVKILQIPVGEMEVFSYIVFDIETKEGLIVDPAGDSEKLLSIIAEEALKIKFIVNTHAHADHTAANISIKNATGASIVMHKDDEEFSRTKESMEWNKKMGFSSSPLPDLTVEDNTLLHLNNFTVRFIHTPGHTPGSSCVLIENNLFTGDTLFVGAVGRTDLPGSSFDELINSLKKLIDTLAPETIVWPGHDYGDFPFSTLKQEKETNPYITDFITDI